jgi:hypothetical protein
MAICEAEPRGLPPACLRRYPVSSDSDDPQSCGLEVEAEVRAKLSRS